MSKRFWQIIILLISLLLLTATMSCFLEDDSRSYSLFNVSVSPPAADNTVEVWLLEILDDQGSTVLVEHDILVGQTSSYKKIAVGRKATKVRFFAIPSAAYKFDHWTKGNSGNQHTVGSERSYELEIDDSDENTAITAHFIPLNPDAEPTQGTMAGNAECTTDGFECSCQLSISFEGKDLYNGSYPVTRVILRVNGDVWDDSGSISQINYHKVVTRTVDCGTTFNMVLTVENSIGQVVTVTRSLTTPVP